MEVCEALGHLTEVGAGQAAGENCEVPSIPRVCYGREHCVCSDPAGLTPLMVSVTCVPRSAPSCPSRQLHNPSHCLGEPQGPSREESLREGLADQSGLGWAGPICFALPIKAQHFTHVRTVCRGSSSALFLLRNSSLLRELPDVQAGFRKSRGTKYHIASIHWIIEKAR